jgi:dimethylsulfone monooxygenase
VILDNTREHDQAPLLASPHKFKLAVFAFNGSSGLTITSAEGPPEVSWAESKRIAVMADRAGMDAIIPIGRWRGFGGELNFNHRSFETFTWAAAIAAVTEKIHVFATFHVPTVHPVRAAKEIATIDHISEGRFGLNILAGWQADELAMFGHTQREHDERYDFAEEWTEFVLKIWEEEGEFDWDGKYFQSPGVYSNPKPIQKDRPTFMSAGASPRGREFATKYADLNFILVPTLDQAPPLAAEIKAKGKENGRDIQVFGNSYIVVGDTEKEAKDTLRHYVGEKGDWAGAWNLINNLIPNSSSASADEYRGMAFNFMAGYSGAPLVGTPEQVVEGMLKMSEAGVDGVTVGWLDYEEGIRNYSEQLQPLMVEAGLREEEPLSDFRSRSGELTSDGYAGERIVAELKEEMGLE